MQFPRDNILPGGVPIAPVDNDVFRRLSVLENNVSNIVNTTATVKLTSIKMNNIIDLVILDTLCQHTSKHSPKKN